MTERDRDLEDMSLLARSGLDYNLVFEECKMQSDMSAKGDVWEASLNEKLLELEDKYGIQSRSKRNSKRMQKKRWLD